jgi:hypothetical protein
MPRLLIGTLAAAGHDRQRVHGRPGATTDNTNNNNDNSSGIMDEQGEWCHDRHLGGTTGQKAPRALCCLALFSARVAAGRRLR